MITALEKIDITTMTGSPSMDPRHKPTKKLAPLRFLKFRNRDAHFFPIAGMIAGRKFSNHSVLIKGIIKAMIGCQNRTSMMKSTTVTPPILSASGFQGGDQSTFVM